MFRKLVVALVAPLLAASACAKEATDVIADPIAAIRAVPDAAAAAGSARFEMTIAFESADGGFTITSTGGYSGDQMAMEMDLGGALAGLAGSLGGSLPDGVDEPMQVVVDGHTAYLRVPVLDALAGTDGWLSATPEELDAVAPLGLGSGTGDPSQLLQALRGVADDVEEVGSEEVRGVPTTHYRATVDLSKALDVTLADVPVEVWVDDEGRGRRLVLDLGDVAAGLLGGAGRATLTVDLFDYGDDVHIDIPSAEETTPITDVLGRFGDQG